MNYIKKNRFLVWLMWLIPIACTGWVGVVAWTVIQICLANDEIERKKESEKPFEVTEEIIEINKDENLTEQERQFKKAHPYYVKTKEGWWWYIGE